MFLKYHPRAWSPGREHCLCLCTRVHTQTQTHGCTHACLLTHVLRLPPQPSSTHQHEPLDVCERALPHSPSLLGAGLHTPQQLGLVNNKNSSSSSSRCDVATACQAEVSVLGME